MTVDRDGLVRRALGQHSYRIRFDWGITAAALAAEESHVVVVVDVLSFTTTVSVAVEQGAEVLPFPWRDGRAAAYARENGAVLALSRRDGLSPEAMARGAVGGRVVVPSPNGSSLAFALRDSGCAVFAGCLRNRSAVADALARYARQGDTVSVIAAGERWPDGSMRPCAEDLWGAGAVLAHLPRAALSPEARLAADSFAAVRAGFEESLTHCAGGQELILGGFAEDVSLAAQIDQTDVVPVLLDGAFRPWDRAPAGGG